jgi:two-component system chemotaxis response regulator CheY
VKRVMTIDDSTSMRQMVAFTLEDAGFEVVQAVDGRDALEKLQGRDIHLFLADLNMPNMDGIELTRQLRAMPAYRFVPIVLLTTESHPEKKQQGKAAGATGWIVKPFDPGKLLAVVNKVVR